jgi:hypothetical protein
MSDLVTHHIWYCDAGHELTVSDDGDPEAVGITWFLAERKSVTTCDAIMGGVRCGHPIMYKTRVGAA